MCVAGAGTIYRRQASSWHHQDGGYMWIVTKVMRAAVVIFSIIQIMGEYCLQSEKLELLLPPHTAPTLLVGCDQSSPSQSFRGSNKAKISPSRSNRRKNSK